MLTQKERTDVVTCKRIRMKVRNYPWRFLMNKYLMLQYRNSSSAQPQWLLVRCRLEERCGLVFAVLAYGSIFPLEIDRYETKKRMLRYANIMDCFLTVIDHQLEQQQRQEADHLYAYLYKEELMDMDLLVLREMSVLDDMRLDWHPDLIRVHDGSRCGPMIIARLCHLDGTVVYASHQQRLLQVHLFRNDDQYAGWTEEKPV